MPYFDQCCPCSPCQCSCNCQNSSSVSNGQPAYIFANGWMNDYARCVLSKYDHLSYDLDTMPCYPCSPGNSCNYYPCCTPYFPSNCCRALCYLNSVNDAQQTVAANSPVLFATDRVSNNCCIQHAAGSSSFTLSCPGVYLIQYNANVSSAPAAADATRATPTPTPIPSLALFSGGTIIPGSQSSGSSTSLNLSASTLVSVPCSTADSIYLANSSGNELLISNANIIIIKIA